MKSDGQLYQRLHKGEMPPLPPPGAEPCVCQEHTEKLHKKGDMSEQILIIAVIFLLVTENIQNNLPIIIALFYLLLT